MQWNTCLLLGLLMASKTHLLVVWWILSAWIVNLSTVRSQSELLYCFGWQTMHFKSLQRTVDLRKARRKVHCNNYRGWNKHALAVIGVRIEMWARVSFRICQSDDTIINQTINIFIFPKTTLRHTSIIPFRKSKEWFIVEHKRQTWRNLSRSVHSFWLPNELRISWCYNLCYKSKVDGCGIFHN